MSARQNPGLMYFSVDLFHDNDVKFVELRTSNVMCLLKITCFIATYFEIYAFEINTVKIRLISSTGSLIQWQPSLLGCVYSSLDQCVQGIPSVLNGNWPIR